LRKQMMVIALACAVLLAGCQQIPLDKYIPIPSGDDNFVSMEETPDLSYEVPASTPGILINQLGYMPESKKVAVFQGDELPDVFYVIDMESKETVYTGFLEEQGYNQELEEYNSYGDFSGLQTPGNYYIEAPVLGRSYSFSIGEDIYRDVFKEACRQYYYNRCGITLTTEYAGENAHNACHIGKVMLKEDTSVSVDVSGGWHQDEKGQKDVITAAQAMSVMLLSYELYEKAFTDDYEIPESGNGIPDILDEVKYEVEWMLKMQDKQTGEVYSGVSVYGSNNDASGKSSDIYLEPSSAEAERAFAMALAKFSYLYQNFDTEYATYCLQAADRAWKHAELDLSGESDETNKWKFAAAAELYRAAGQRSCHKYIEEFINSEENLYEQDEIVLMGCVTYISTKQKVELALCDQIMKMLMQQAERISEDANDNLYLAAANKEQDNNRQLLLNIMYLMVVNHIIANYEYGTAIENHLHYLFGRNDIAVSYVDGFGENSYGNGEENIGIMKQFDTDSKLIFMLSEVIDRSAG